MRLDGPDAQGDHTSRAPAGFGNVLFLSDEAIRDLGRSWWTTQFPAIPGHWMGVEVRSPPATTDMRISDPARSRALVEVTIGDEGAAVVFERIDGAWRPARAHRAWIT